MTQQRIELLLVGPFDSAARIEFLPLAGRDDDRGEPAHSRSRSEEFRRAWLEELRAEKAPAGETYKLDRFVSFRYDVAGTESEAFECAAQESWIDGHASAPDTLVFDLEGGSTPRTEPLLRVDSASRVALEVPSALPWGEDGARLEAKLALLDEYGVLGIELTDLQLSVYHHGVGVFSVRAVIDAEVEAEDLPLLLEPIQGAVVLLPAFVDVVEGIDRRLGAAADRALQRTEASQRVFPSHRSDGTIVGRPRWAHAALLGTSLATEDMSAPLGDATWDVVRVSHPDGAVNMSGVRAGFVHLGWGRSMLIGLTPRRQRVAVETLRRLEADWRILQLFNLLLAERLSQFAALQNFPWRDVRDPLRQVARINLECELFRLDHQHYLQMLQPFAHLLYRHGEASWRMQEMEANYQHQIATLQLLREGWIQRKSAADARRLNSLVLLISMISLVTVSAGFTTFLGGDAVSTWSTGAKIGVVLVLPLALAMFAMRHRIDLFPRRPPVE